jgi:hypothetical protein
MSKHVFLDAINVEGGLAMAAETSSQATSPPSSSAMITVVRNSSDDTETRQIIVFLDGKNQGELMFGDSMTLQVTPGSHLLRVDNTWNRKDLQVEIRAGEQLQFGTKSTASQLSKFLLGFIGFGPYQVSLEPLPSRA